MNVKREMKRLVEALETMAHGDLHACRPPAGMVCVANRTNAPGCVLVPEREDVSKLHRCHVTPPAGQACVNHGTNANECSFWPADCVATIEHWPITRVDLNDLEAIEARIRALGFEPDAMNLEDLQTQTFAAMRRGMD